MSVNRQLRKSTMEQQLYFISNVLEDCGRRKALEIAVAMLYNSLQEQLRKQEAALDAAAAVPASTNEQPSIPTT
jgi:hypothetical protein